MLSGLMSKVIPLRRLLAHAKLNLLNNHYYDSTSKNVNIPDNGKASRLDFEFCNFANAGRKEERTFQILPTTKC